MGSASSPNAARTGAMTLATRARPAAAVSSRTRLRAADREQREDREDGRLLVRRERELGFQPRRPVLRGAAVLQSRVPRRPLLRFVQPSSARPVEPVRRDSSFAEKQESYPALLLVVQGERGDSRARALAVSRMESSSGHAGRFVLACGPVRVPRIRRAERRGADAMRVSTGGASGKGHSRTCRSRPARRGARGAPG